MPAPFNATERGIGRGSIVYGAVDLDASGNVRSDHWNIESDYLPYESDDRDGWRVHKGIFLREGNSSSGDLVKVSWQPIALGRSAISRGTPSWMLNDEIFTPEEALLATKDLANGQVHFDILSSKRLQEELKVGAPSQLDALIDNPLGNMLVMGALGSALFRRDGVGSQAAEMTYIRPALVA